MKGHMRMFGTGSNAWHWAIVVLCIILCGCGTLPSRVTPKVTLRHTTTMKKPLSVQVNYERFRNNRHNVFKIGIGSVTLNTGEASHDLFFKGFRDIFKEVTQVKNEIPSAGYFLIIPEIVSVETKRLKSNPFSDPTFCRVVYRLKILNSGGKIILNRQFSGEVSRREKINSLEDALTLGIFANKLLAEAYSRLFVDAAQEAFDKIQDSLQSSTAFVMGTPSTPVKVTPSQKVEKTHLTVDKKSPKIIINAPQLNLGKTAVVKGKQIKVESSVPLSYAQNDKLKQADRLNERARQLYQQGKYSEAISIAQKILDIREKALGPGHLDVAYDLGNLAEIYSSLGEYSKAEPLHKRSRAILEKVLGLNHLYVAYSLSKLAGIYKPLGDYTKAESLYKRSLAIREKIFGPDHLKVASTLNNLATFYFDLGEYAKAEPLFKKSLAITSKALGPDHPDVALSLNNLAELYRSLDDYTKAEPLYQRALAIWEKSLGPDHRNVAYSLNNLGLLYQTLGDYAKAEPLLKRSHSIWEKDFGPYHPKVAVSLSNLGLLYQAIGDYTKAKPLYKRSLAIKEKALGPDHPDVALSLNNLAELYRSLGDYTKAEPLYKRSLSIWEKSLGPDHHRVALSLHNLARLYQGLGEYAKAEPLLKRSLAIKEKVLGPDHPDVALSLNNFSMLFFSLGDYAKAEHLLKRSHSIWEKSLGPDHPRVALSLNNQATLYASNAKYQKAHNLFIEAQRIDVKLIEQIMSFTSEEQKLKFLLMKKNSMYAFFNLVNQHEKQIAIAKKDALDIWLKRKGVILEAQKRFQEAIVYSDDPEAINTFQTLARARSRFSKLTFSGPGKEGIEKYKQNMAEIEKDIQGLEAKLSKISQAFALKQKISKADSHKVASALPKNTALIEFARIRKANFKAKGKEKLWNKYIYLAFVLHSGKGDTPELIDLGDAEKIDNLISKLKKEIADTQGMEAEQFSRKVYDLAFAPLKNSLKGVTEIFISPDGNLNLIPFEILQNTDGKYLIEKYTFNYLSAGRDIIGFGQLKGKAGKSLLIGDPDFDISTTERNNSLRSLGIKHSEAQYIAVRSTDMRSYSFDRLPGTKKEVETIHALLGADKSELYTGKAALEEVLKYKEAPSILHLATHGFFLTDEEMLYLNDNATGLTVQSISKKIEPSGKKNENPMLRAGIALAGANNTLKSDTTKESDGIVTAEKILGLKLRGTDMVVLSACETGLGEVKSGEGVYGLQRAFTQAGAKSIVMSMWSVPDKETQELMTEFYKNIVSGKMNRNQALRQAVLKEMKITEQRYGKNNPLFWGAFIFLGEP